MARKSMDEAWADDSVCLICKEYMSKSLELMCSATCEDLYSLGLHRNDQQQEDLYS